MLIPSGIPSARAFQLNSCFGVPAPRPRNARAQKIYGQSLLGWPPLPLLESSHGSENKTQRLSGCRFGGGDVMLYNIQYMFIILTHSPSPVFYEEPSSSASSTQRNSLQSHLLVAEKIFVVRMGYILMCGEAVYSK